MDLRHFIINQSFALGAILAFILAKGKIYPIHRPSKIHMKNNISPMSATYSFTLPYSAHSLASGEHNLLC